MADRPAPVPFQKSLSSGNFKTIAQDSMTTANFQFVAPKAPASPPAAAPAQAASSATGSGSQSKTPAK